jgi:hypothetical protein
MFLLKSSRIQIPDASEKLQDMSQAFLERIFLIIQELG